MTKTPTNMRLSDEALKLKELLAQKLGIDETAVVEMALRRLAEAEGVRSCELQFQQHIEKILGKCYINPSEGDHIVIHYSHCSEWEREQRYLEQVQATEGKTYKTFFYPHPPKRSKTEESKEAHEVKK